MSLSVSYLIKYSSAQRRLSLTCTPGDGSITAVEVRTVVTAGVVANKQTDRFSNEGRVEKCTVYFFIRIYLGESVVFIFCDLRGCSRLLNKVSLYYFHTVSPCCCHSGLFSLFLHAYWWSIWSVLLTNVTDILQKAWNLHKGPVFYSLLVLDNVYVYYF